MKKDGCPIWCSVFNSRHVQSACGIAAVAMSIAIAFRFASVCARLAVKSYEPWWHTAVFLSAAAAICIGPGLFLLSKLRQFPANPFLAATTVFSTSLGATMLFSWVLYAIGLFTRFVGFALVGACVLLGAVGLVKLLRRTSVQGVIRHLAMSPCEIVCLATSLLLCEGLFEAVTGASFTSWDAMVSWDKWAADIAARRALGGYVAGAYPPGIPLLVGLLYKVCLPPGTDLVLTSECLLVPGFFQIFPLLACLAVLAAARSAGAPSLWALGLLLGNGVFIFCLLKHVGYVDVPLGAFATAATALLLEYGTARERRGTIFTVLLFALFPVAFTKGNGFGFLLQGTAVFAVFRRRDAKTAFAAAGTAIAIAGLYYLHQWVFGIWTNWGEKSLFNHALHVFFSHSYLIHPNFAHFMTQIRLTCGYYGYHSITGMVIAGSVGFVALAGTFVSRRTRPAAILLALATGVWFFTGSYDARNFVFLTPLFAIIVPVAATDIRPRPLFVAVALMASAACVHSVFRYRTFEMARRPLRHYVMEREVTMTPAERRALHLELSVADANTFADSDLVRRAPHIISRGQSYRFFFGKGVFACARREYGGYPKALAIAGGGWVPAPTFRPIADFSYNRTHAPTLYIESPEMHEVPFRCSGGGENATLVDVDVSGIDFGDSGFVLLGLSSDKAKCSLRLIGDHLADTMFKSHQEAAEIGIAFFVPRETSSLRLLLDSNSAVTVTRASIGF